MLGLFGIRLHPAWRALIGAVLVALGLGFHHPGAAVVGLVLIGWALLGLLGIGRTDTRRDDSRTGPTDRQFR